MLIMLSACLAGIRCRYDGSANSDTEAIELLCKGMAIPLCPEQIAGLNTPRSPVEIVNGTGKDVWEGKAFVRDEIGEDYSEQFKIGAQEVLRLCSRYRIKIAWLKSKSPSCGCGHIYDGRFQKTLRQGDGVTAALLRKAGILVIGRD